MCSCGSLSCACYRQGRRDGFGEGYVAGFTDHALGRPPLPQFASRINSILGNTPNIKPIEPRFQPIDIKPIEPRLQPIDIKPIEPRLQPIDVKPIEPRLQPIDIKPIEHFLLKY